MFLAQRFSFIVYSAQSINGQ